MKKNILMIYPEIPNTFWTFKSSLDLIKCKAAMPPLGLMTIARMLPDDYTIRLIDMNVSTLTIDDISDSDIVFISAMIIQEESFENVIDMCQRAGTPVVAGGPYPTSLHEKIKGVDYFVLNEAEITLPQFIEDLENGCPKRIYEDTTKPDITKTPPPRFDLFNVNDYFIMPLQFSRGCPFNCEFCDIIELFGRIPRTKTVDQFINEMDLLYESGFLGTVFIVDDNFIGHKKKVKTLLKEIILWQEKHNYPYMLFTEASINLAEDEELLDLMEKAGFLQVFIGIETPDLDTLKKINKNQNHKSDLHESIRKIQERGIEVMGGFIVGFDTDPENIFDLQIDFIKKAGIPAAMIGILHALPNTQLYRRLKEEGRITGESTGDNLDLTVNFIPKIPEEQLFRGYKKIVREVYNPKSYFENVMTFYNNISKRYLLSDMIQNNFRWKLLKGATRAYRRHTLKALYSLFKLFFSKNGIHYFRFFMRTLFMYITRTDSMLLIQLMLKGHHYIKIAEMIENIDDSKFSEPVKYHNENVLVSVEKT